MVKLRKITYPPDFLYVAPGELRSAMSAMANAVIELDGLLHEPRPLSSEDHSRIITLLDDIGQQAATLGPGAPDAGRADVAATADGASRDALPTNHDGAPRYLVMMAACRRGPTPRR